ncbi:MAG: DNA-protecting protein DprA [Desulfuromonas sp.]|nr:MAG: DNA-protecting protein DprA [Desulfuromonas sp.]
MVTMTADETAWLRLHLTPGLGRIGLIHLMKAYGCPRAALAAGPAGWSGLAGFRSGKVQTPPAENSPPVTQARESLSRTGARIVSLLDREAYPPLLRETHDPPALLYVRGNLPCGEALAVVGARRASTAGRRLTAEISRELASRDITIVSGLARGIDTAAHQGALDGEGTTVGVLGCGIDRIYPPENRRLFLEVLERGAILSEFPPGTPPLARHFPGRNRIISGMCRGVLVVEAAEGSGSLITADFALEQGRDVFAVPGPVYSPTGGGVNRLLKEGANLVTGAADILDALWPHLPSPALRQRQDTFAAALAGDALTLYGLIGDTPLHPDELARKSALTPMEVSSILLHLELQGGIEQLPGMRFVRSRKP